MHFWWRRRIQNSRAIAKRPSGTPMLTPRIINLWSGPACPSPDGAVDTDSVGDGGTVVTTEMLVMVETWPAEFEVMAVSVIMLVLARKEVENAVKEKSVEVSVEVIAEVLKVEVVESASEVEPVSSVND